MSEARGVTRVLPARPASDGAGVRMRRIAGIADLDPFLLLDEFGSDDPQAYIAGFPDHPHRGFETVTYMLDGHMEHRDNAGHHGRLGPGDVQWMTAGRGIVHSEMPLQEAGLMRGFQLWVNLPASEKMCAPRYQEFAAAEVPAVEAAGVSVKVIAGEYGGAHGPVRGIVTEPTYLDLHLDPGAGLALDAPGGHTALLYAYEGSIDLGEGAPGVRAGHAAVLGGAGEVRVAAGAQAPARALFLAARALGEPVAQYGPFVMNTREEIEQAVRDFREGRF